MKFNPGRLNKRGTFKRATSTKNDYGGTEPTYEDVLTTWVEKRTISAYNQFAIEAGASALNEDAAFVMRQRNGFAPVKSDLIVVEGIEYTIKAIRPYVDDYNSRAAEPKVIQESYLLYLVGVRRS